MNPIIIIGTGLAGYTVARETRKLDKQVPIIVITADAGEFYSKPTLSNAFLLNKSAEELVLKSVDQMRTYLHCEILAENRVTSISTIEHIVNVGVHKLKYSKLVLALGADPIQFVSNGEHAPQNISVNNLTDYRRFRSEISERETITILGAGLIGCEFANDLCNGGYKVNVIDLYDGPIRRFLPHECSKALQSALSGIGVKWHFGSGVDRTSQAAGKVYVSLKNGTKIASDAILSAIGLRPKIELAMSAGIRVGRGIITDHCLRTNATDVYALGDCAETNGLIMPFVLPIMHAARALAATLVGMDTPVKYPPMPIVVKTPQCPIVVSPPTQSAVGNWRISGEGVDLKAVFLDADGAMRGFALIGKFVAEKNEIIKQIPMLIA